LKRVLFTVVTLALLISAASTVRAEAVNLRLGTGGPDVAQSEYPRHEMELCARFFLAVHLTDRAIFYSNLPT